MSVPTDNNIIVKDYNKIIKYKDFKIDFEKMGHLKTIIVSAIVGVLGRIKKGRDKHINQISAHIEYRRLDYLLWKVLSMWLEN